MSLKYSNRANRKDAFLRPNDPKAYKDLLLFEERLKSNVVSLNKRKKRYQLFLVHLLIIIVLVLSEITFQTEFLSIPYNCFLLAVLPAGHKALSLHPYFKPGFLLVAVTTLALFFASGMYSEKIGYANRYVPHANRALRSFNMYLNARHKPFSSRLYNPLSVFVSRGSEAQLSPAPAGEGRADTNSNRKKMLRRSSVPINPIPPSNNPRGELIFSARVDPAFREGYEKYRAGFERRRDELRRRLLEQKWRNLNLWPWNWWKFRRGFGDDAGRSGGGTSINEEKLLQRRDSPVLPESHVTGRSVPERGLH